MNKTKKFLTHKEACEYLEISSATMNRWLAKKKVPAYKPMGRWQFVRDELDERVNKSKEGIDDG